MAFFFSIKVFEKKFLCLLFCVCSFITLAQNKIGSHITRITVKRDVDQFVGTFRYAANEFYLKICFYWLF